MHFSRSLLARSLVGLLASNLIACSERVADRANAVQIPLAILIIFLPLISPFVAIYFRKYIWWMLALHFALLLAHESGVSSASNIRLDFPLYLLSIFIHLFVLGWLSRKKD